MICWHVKYGVGLSYRQLRTYVFFLLGWKFSLSEDKRMEFAEVTALGVTTQLADRLDGRLAMCNTVERTRELVETVDLILRRRRVEGAGAEASWRMQFARTSSSVE